MYKTVASKLGHGLYMRQDNKFLWVNESFAKIFDFTQAEIKTMNYLDMVYSEDRNELLQLVSKSNRGEIEQFEIEFRGVKKDGTVIDISATNKRISFEGKPATIGSVIDISDRKRMEVELKESQERYRNLVESSPIGIMVHQKGMIEYANPMAIQMLGAELENEIIGKSIYQFVHLNFREIVTKRIDNIENQGKSAPPLYQKFIRVDGKEIDVEVSGIPIQLGNLPAVEIMFWDVTERKKEEELIRYRAYHDTLTDLPNYYKFQLDFAEEFNSDQTFTILYIDLDGIKKVNDIYGRQAGDIVLMKVGARLSGVIGQKGLIYRMVGDEFTVVLPGQVEERELREIAENINRIVGQPIYTSNNTVHVSLYIGAVYYPDDGVELDMILRHADMAMNHAKRSNTFFKKYDL